MLSVIGGVAGSLLLLVTPSAVFDRVVPWLLFFATLLFIFGGRARKYMACDDSETQSNRLMTLLVSICGGYFNGGLGIVLLAMFSAQGYCDLNLMNGSKNVLSFVLPVASVLTFAIAGIVYWEQAVVMMIAATSGGFTDARLARCRQKR